MKWEVDVEMAIYQTFTVEAETMGEAQDKADLLKYETPLTEWEWGDGFARAYRKKD